MAQDENPPNATLYVQHLNERIKIPTLIESLREIFGEFGDIIDIVAKRNLKARGQAFVVYDSTDSAELALESLQGFELHGQEMTLAYAKSRSDATVEREDTKGEFAAHKERRLAEKQRRQEAEEAEAAEAAARQPAKREAPEALPDRPVKVAKPTPAAATGVPDEYLPPNKTLVVREYPESYTQDDIAALFRTYPGFREVRVVGRLKIAFAEFKDVESAVAPKEATNGTIVDGNMIRVTYQKG